MKKVEMLNWQLIIIVGIVLLVSTGIAHEKTVIVPLCGVKGDAIDSDVVKGKTFSSRAAGRGVTGTLELPPTMQTYTTPTYGMTFNLLPADTFTMGSPDGICIGSLCRVAEPGRSLSETQHQVTLSASFYMQTTEVTQQQWRDVVLAAENAGYIGVGLLDEKPSSSHSGAYKANYPVEEVSWNDISSWLIALNQLTGKNYTLPTEAQWEYAARATTISAWAYLHSYDTSTTPGETIGAGFNSNLDAMGWYSWNNALIGGYASSTKPVAKKQPNKWGLYDMHGNVSEWCYDLWDGTPYSPDPVIDPIGDTGSGRVFRGGSWGVDSKLARAAFRDSGVPGFSNSSHGFRLVLPSSQ